MVSNPIPIEQHMSDRDIQLGILTELRNLNAMLKPLAEIASRSKPLFKLAMPGGKNNDRG